MNRITQFAVSIIDSDTSIPKPTSTGEQVADILSFVFGLIGAISVLVLVFAGIRFMTSQGEPQKIAQARNTILYAIVGIVVAVFSFTIVRFVIGVVG